MDRLNTPGQRSGSKLRRQGLPRTPYRTGRPKAAPARSPLVCRTGAPWGAAGGRFGLLLLGAALFVLGGGSPPARAASAELAPADVIASRVLPRIVKIYGAGGVRGLEGYQSGFLISPQGHVLTAWSYVLDTDFITAVLHDGRRFQAKLVGADPRLEVAVLEIDAEDLAYFDLRQAVSLTAGDPVFAASNLFGVAVGEEPASVQHGRVAVVTSLAARRGAFETPYQGPVYVLDAMTNNPGAAGGALTDRQGRLAGVLGKELRSSLDNAWLNYAIPANELRQAVQDILAGKVRPAAAGDAERRRPAEPLSPALLGLVFVPNVLPKTPPFIDRVLAGSPADRAGLRPDDLILFINDRLAGSITDLVRELSYIDRIDPVKLTVQRGQELIEVTLKAP